MTGVIDRVLPIAFVMLRTIANTAAWIAVQPCVLSYHVWRKLIGCERALSAVSERSGHWPGLWGVTRRRALYGCLIGSVGRGVHFGYQTLLSKPQATLGDRVYLGRFCTVGWVQIGEDTRIADGVQLLSGAHHHGSSNTGIEIDRVDHRPIRIGRRVWIGANAVIMADVADDAIVGAGAVVTRPVPAGQTVVGVPARSITKQPPARHAA